MGLSESYKKQVRLVLVMVLVLAVPALLLYILFVNSQRDYFTDRNLRLLSVVSKQLVTGVGNYQNVFASMIDSVKSELAAKGENKANSSEATKTSGVRGTANGSAPPARRSGEPDRDPAQVIQENLYRSNLSLRPRFQVVADSEAKRLAGTRNNEAATRLNLVSDQSGYWLYLMYDGDLDKPQQGFKINLKVNVGDFVSQFIGKDVWVGAGEFDDMLIARQSDGAVIFQSEGASFRATGLNYLQGTEKENGKQALIDLKSIGSQTGVRSVLIAADTYELFMQPVKLQVDGDANTTEPEGGKAESGKADGFVVCGLVRIDHFRQETNTISPNYLIAIIFLVLLTALAFPLIKLWLMAHNNRLHAADVGLLVAAMVLSSGLLILGALDGCAYLRLRGQIASQLEELSNSICKHLVSEMVSAVDQLDKLTGVPEFETSIAQLRATKQRGGSQTDPGYRQVTSVFNSAGYSGQFTYPYFDSIFVADNTGLQRYRLTAWQYPIAHTSVKERAYFQNAQEGQTWGLDGATRQFFAEPVNSKTSGTMLTGISTRLEDRASDKTGSAPATSPDAAWVAVIATRLLSVTDPIMPDAFDFAIIDRDGNVLYHSDEKRALHENFFQESDNDLDLQSLVFARGSGSLGIHYLGRAHQAYVRPIENLPWTLVVLADNSILAEANFDVLLGSAVLLFLYSLLFAGIVYALCPLHDKDKSAWIWPDSSRPDSYGRVVVVNLCLIGLLFVAITALNGWALLVAGGLIPIVGVFLAYVILARRGWGFDRKAALLRVLGSATRRVFAWGGNPAEAAARSEAAEPGASARPQRFLDYKRQYVLAGATSVLLVSALPSIAWFKAIHDREMRLLVRFEQASIAEEMAEREVSLKQNHPLEALKQKHPWGAQEVSNDGEGWGDYYSLFFDTRKIASDASPDAGSQGPASGNSLETFLALLSPPSSRTLHLLKPLRGFRGNDLGTGTGAAELDFKRTRENDRDSIMLQSTVPMLRAPGNVMSLLTWWPGPMILLSGLLLGALYLLVRMISRRVFLIDLEGPRFVSAVDGNSEGLSRLNCNLLVLVTTRTAGPAATLNVKGIQEIDLAQANEGASQRGPGSAVGADKSAKEWFEAQRRRLLEGGARVVAIHNFDFGMEDPVLNTRKLLFLRDLSGSGIKAIVLSSVDPLAFEFSRASANHEGDDGARQRDKESELLNGTLGTFLKVHIENVEGLDKDIDRGARPASDSRNEAEEVEDGLACLSERLLQRRDGEMIVRPRANPRLTTYSSIWSNCTPEERLALFFVAHDRFVDGNNPAVQDLLSRGLVARDPAIRPMSEEFRQFIIASIKPEEMKAAEAEASHWNALRTPLMVGLGLVVVFLFYTQENLFSSAMGIVAVLTGSIPAILNATRLFTGAGGSAQPP